jgi:hypothetical protein
LLASWRREFPFFTRGRRAVTAPARPEGGPTGGRRPKIFPPWNRCPLWPVSALAVSRLGFRRLPPVALSSLLPALLASGKKKGAFALLHSEGDDERSIAGLFKRGNMDFGKRRSEGTSYPLITDQNPFSCHHLIDALFLYSFLFCFFFSFSAASQVRYSLSISFSFFFSVFLFLFVRSSCYGLAIPMPSDTRQDAAHPQLTMGKEHNCGLPERRGAL